MARRRVRAAVRKASAGAVDEEAHRIAEGVYWVARETLEGTPREELPLPVFIFAPLAYASEMMAHVVCERHGWSGEGSHPTQHEVGLYLATGLHQVTAAAFEGFDAENCEAWVGAARHQAASEAKR